MPLLVLHHHHSHLVIDGIVVSVSVAAVIVCRLDEDVLDSQSLGKLFHLHLLALGLLFVLATAGDHLLLALNHGHSKHVSLVGAIGWPLLPPALEYHPQKGGHR